MDLRLSGTSTILSFFEDDTIDTVRQHVALGMNSHPDRLFIQIETELPADYYSSNPKRWMDLFFRLSYDGNRVTKESLNVYLTQIRVGSGMYARDVTLEDWQAVTDLSDIFDPKESFREWRILGVDESKSFVLPLPPREIPLKEASRARPNRQSLFSTIHPFKTREIKATEVDPDSSENVLLNYFPYFQATTPINIETLRSSIKANHDQIAALLELKAPKSKISILRAKWFIPLVSSKFSMPRTRFEQIFYGMTVSEETPYIGYFTSKQEVTRHKFYVEDPKVKKPFVDLPLWKSWTTNTQPQRRLPTLLLYRGKARTNFTRIAITPKDITISTFRGKNSTETIEHLQETSLKWLLSFDALIPFLVASDYGIDRWKLSDVTLFGSYPKDITELDMRRFDCLRNVFREQGNESFRLLRTDHEANIDSQLLQVSQLMSERDTLTSQDIQNELNITREEADSLFAQAQEAQETLELTGPVVKFSSSEVLISGVTNIERVINYANILRFVLTSDSSSIDQVCPRRVERVEAVASAIPQASASTITLKKSLLDALADLEEDEPEPQEQAPAPVAPPVEEKKKVADDTKVYGYFNKRLNKFDPVMFDQGYPKLCEQKLQVVVIPKNRPSGEYDYRQNDEEDDGKILSLPNGDAICPEYWCMKDEIPLRKDQLEIDEDGAHCPVCWGMIRKTNKEDTVDYTVFERDSKTPFPRMKEGPNGKKVPCCYKKFKREKEETEDKKDEFYIMNSIKPTDDSKRLAYITEPIAVSLQIKTDYAKNVALGRLKEKAGDMFRVSLGRPSESLPELLGLKERKIPPPAEQREIIMRCSFFRTWSRLGEGDTVIDRMIAGISKAFEDKTLGVLDEIEYTTALLDCRVMQINSAAMTMSCGFWGDRTRDTNRTIALIDTDILCHVTRKPVNRKTELAYVVDVNKFSAPLRKTLHELHTRACTSESPTFEDAVNELIAKNKGQYQVILDPFGRIQAVFVPREIILPCQPVKLEIPLGVTTRNGYADIPEEELPESEVLGAFLKDTRHKGFKWEQDVYDTDGRFVEFVLASGFRAPFKPEESKGVHIPKEVMKTIRENDENILVEGKPNQADLKLAREISYTSEVFEFLMYSLSKDLNSGDYDDLKESIMNRSETLYKGLSDWLDKESYWTTAQEPVQFVNKVRAPCGQMTQDSCKKSTLCGWHANSCRIKVNPVVDRRQVLTRLTRTLRDNMKQRALVLDGRLSPFFSTILYLEMPHELITSAV